MYNILEGKRSKKEKHHKYYFGVFRVLKKGDLGETRTTHLQTKEIYVGATTQPTAQSPNNSSKSCL